MITNSDIFIMKMDDRITCLLNNHIEQQIQKYSSDYLFTKIKKSICDEIESQIIDKEYQKVIEVLYK